MRIISGKFGGRRLIAPDTKLTRPVTEMARNAICNVLADRIDGAAVLDLYAGSGALGLETLSRGAARAVFVDVASAAVVAIRQNVQSLELDTENQTKIIKQTVESYLESTADSFDIIFLDPPYDDFSLELVQIVSDHLKPSGVLVISTSKKAQIPATIGQLSQAQNKQYGDTQISYFVK